MSELRKIPNVGKQTEQDLIAMGYRSIESLRGKRAEELYAEECRLRGFELDRCQLYIYREMCIRDSYWICPVKKFNIGLWGGQTIGKVVLCNAQTGECTSMDVQDVPEWVDRVLSLIHI